MKKIPLTQGKVALVDDEDYSLVSRFNWHTINRKHCFYAGTNIPKGNGKFRYVLMHRMIAGVLDSKSDFVDHKDFDGLNNTSNNLRICTKAQNCQNRRSSVGSSKYKGVHWCNTWNTWIAQIGFKGKRYKIGSFDNEEAAARSYNVAAEEYFGEFACLNIIPTQS